MGFGRFYDRLASILDSVDGEIEMRKHPKDEKFTSIVIVENGELSEGFAYTWSDFDKTMIGLLGIDASDQPDGVWHGYGSRHQVNIFRKVNGIYCIGERVTHRDKTTEVVRPATRATFPDVMFYVGQQLGYNQPVVGDWEHNIPEIAAVNPWIGKK